MNNSVLTTNPQERKVIQVINNKRFFVYLSYDDRHKNGHNIFSISGAYNNSFGCMHEEISKYFPELRKYIKWHLCSSVGPVHYIENTIYNASNIEEKQDKWYFYLEDRLIKIVNKDEKQKFEDLHNKGNLKFIDYPNPMAKSRDFYSARESAIWLEATDEELFLSEEKLKKILIERLPKLQLEFKSAMEELGFIY